MKKIIFVLIMFFVLGCSHRDDGPRIFYENGWLHGYNSALDVIKSGEPANSVWTEYKKRDSLAFERMIR